jgi:hypothetical protein
MKAKTSTRGSKNGAGTMLFKQTWVQMPKGGSTYSRVSHRAGTRVSGMTAGKIKREQSIGKASMYKKPATKMHSIQKIKQRTAK